MRWNPLFLLPALTLGGPLGAANPEPVAIDKAGILRWTDSGGEVALFGANYCLPSSCDYRAAGYVHADRRQLVRQDLEHFARMGWDGMRISFWGDWECCDAAGNLIANDHLDLLDYVLAEAARRGIRVLLTPITTYSAWWPEGRPGDFYPGFSRVYSRSELGTNPAAIAAQCRYLGQLLRHVNPYTGVALKDDPAVLFIEMINEPVHHPEDVEGSVAYINALVDAVRSTGCRKLLFHNLSQDFRIAGAIKASRAQGMTFAWYPTGLNSGHRLRGNYLRAVDAYEPMLRDDLRGMPKLVYEFDSADMISGAMYPAMCRAFREAGAQFAAMFSYDMLATAPYNLGWQTHFLNLVYSPGKAVSAVIAAEVMRRVPLYARFGPYPGNRRFGPFRVSDEEDLAEMATASSFLYDNDTRTEPPDPAALSRVVGVGSSPIAEYEGTGAYFLDRLGAGLWRLELYPDALIVADPFARRLDPPEVVSRLVWHEWPMRLKLPDLGERFEVTPLEPSKGRPAEAAVGGRFEAWPGVYLLSRGAPPASSSLPQRVGRIGLREFICPPGTRLPCQILPEAPEGGLSGRELEFRAEIVGDCFPREAGVHVRAPGDPAFRTIRLSRARGYRYAAGAGPAAEGEFRYFFTAETGAGRVRFPAEEGASLSFRVVSARAPLSLLDPEADAPRLFFTRFGDAMRRGPCRIVPARDGAPAALRITLPPGWGAAADDATCSVTILDRIRGRASGLRAVSALRLRVRGAAAPARVLVTLVERDGTSWSHPVAISPQWTGVAIPLAEFRLGRGVKLPLGYPGRWNTWLAPARGRGGPGDRPDPAAFERLQFSFRPAAGVVSAPGSEQEAWLEIAGAELLPE